MTAEQQKKILKEAKERLKIAMDDDKYNRDMALSDLEFVGMEGKQWPDDIRADREFNGQPCLTINKLPVFIDQVVGDQRMNRPAIKVIPVDSNADVKVAHILGGWIKHVQEISKSDVAVDHGFEHAATCGYGAMRVVTKYVSDTSFDQEAYIEKIDNALSVFWGKHSEYDCSDASYCFVITDMDKEEYEQKYGDLISPFTEGDGNYLEGWATASTVRVAEYFVKEPVKKTIYLLTDGRTVDVVADGDVVDKKREVESYKIKWYLLSGDKVLDSRYWLGKKYIPIIPIWGKELNIGGKRVIRGLIRNAKDSQRMYNYWQSTDTETVALQPRSPFMVTPKQIDGHTAQWKEANKKSFPYLLVNHDKDAPGWPQRQAPPQASSAMTAKIQSADQEMRDTIGLQRASLGMQSNERSGVAIRERKQEGDVGTFAFIDNLSRSIEHMGRVLVDIAPVLLDTERVVRLGLDNGEHEFATVNKPDKDDPMKIINDMSVGTYDVVVTVGPSFTTQRTEARLSMKEFIQYDPSSAVLIGDLYAKNQDWPGAEEVAARLAFRLPPEIKAQQAADAAKKAGEAPPPPPSQPAPPPPSPEELVKLEEAKIRLEEAKIALEEIKVKLAQEQEKLKGLQIKNELVVSESKENIKKMLDEIQTESETSKNGQTMTNTTEE